MKVKKMKIAKSLILSVLIFLNLSIAPVYASCVTNGDIEDGKVDLGSVVRQISEVTNSNITT